MSEVIGSLLRRHRPRLMTKNTMKPLRKIVIVKNARVKRYGKMN
jgi:hypothetical protein